MAGFDELNLPRVALEVNEDNARALACYRKCGFMEEGRLREDRFRREHIEPLVVSISNRSW